VEFPLPMGLGDRSMAAGAAVQESTP
jgi:hypothetical protein